eukprot:CAMPEP_0170372936 /NCGR_PEP_ID=MMETSP0117_2-20130122/9811_1 /TAXON_ID=400756 /ORGANISM="Durinskia baltica, Strain CSIRO CS-38" /LENGTH=51 /DNA_ID=CAMNT_0010627813 /DNA_START=986 /DNA_END=1141 /DNA_ORIENTATION=-
MNPPASDCRARPWGLSGGSIEPGHGMKRFTGAAGAAMPSSVFGVLVREAAA